MLGRGQHLTCCDYRLGNGNVAIAAAVVVAAAIAVEAIITEAAIGADGSRICERGRREMITPSTTSDRAEIRCSQFDGLTRYIVHYCNLPSVVTSIR